MQLLLLQCVLVAYALFAYLCSMPQPHAQFQFQLFLLSAFGCKCGTWRRHSLQSTKGENASGKGNCSYLFAESAYKYTYICESQVGAKNFLHFTQPRIFTFHCCRSCSIACNMQYKETIATAGSSQQTAQVAALLLIIVICQWFNTNSTWLTDTRKSPPNNLPVTFRSSNLQQFKVASKQRAAT